MRITEANNYEEKRESIASDWCAYMLKAFPDAQFVLIPNIEDSVKQYIQDLGVNVLIMSGGDDVGVYSRRDKTESLALEYALENKIPIIGVCRGLQLIHTHFGGRLIEGDQEFVKNHRATKHEIEFKGETQSVNSFHRLQLDEESLSDQFKVVARCKADNSIEAIESKSVLGIMWHPERDEEVAPWNVEIIRNFIEK